MSTPAASNNTNEPPEENIHRASSSLLSLVRRLLTGLLNCCLLQCQLIRRAVNLTFNRNPKPYEIMSSTTALAADQSSLLFSSLPNDVVLNCLARVPRRHYSILSCVSKSFQSLVHSPELEHMRSLMGKDYPIFYVCFSETCSLSRKFHWFTFNPNEKKTIDLINSIGVFSQNILCCSTVSIGSKIYFIGGSMYIASRGLWIFDSWSGKLCEGPRMKVTRMLPGVAVVDEKLYVMGGCGEDQIQVEVFDPNTQTWEVGPSSPHGEVQYGKGLMQYGEIVNEAVALEGKVYGMSYRVGSHIIYDTKDGRCDTFKMQVEDYWKRGGVCVINSVIYVYYIGIGIMWYDSKDKVWRLVKGLDKLDKTIDMVGMVDCNGKLGFLWGSMRGVSIGRPKSNNSIWCAIIVLNRSGVEIHGTVEWSAIVGSVPPYYDIWRCLSVSN